MRGIGHAKARFLVRLIPWITTTASAESRLGPVPRGTGRETRESEAGDRAANLRVSREAATEGLRVHWVWSADGKGGWNPKARTRFVTETGFSPEDCGILRC